MSTPIDLAIQEVRKQAKEFEDTEFEELTLDSIHFQKFSKELKDAIEKFQNLCSLTLNDCQLKSLQNFPALPKLLELIDNNLCASNLLELPNFPDLQSLSLGGNKINTLEEIKPLIKYNQLAELDFLGCEITELDNYREELFKMFPSLLILDNMDKEGKEVELDDEEDDLDEDQDQELEDDDEDDEQEQIESDLEDEEDEEDEEEEEQEPKPRKQQKK